MLPAPRLMILVAGSSPLWFLVALRPAAWPVPVAYLLALLGAGLWGYLRMPKPGELSASRRIPPHFSMGGEQEIRLTVTNRSRRRVVLEIRDDVPDCLALLSRFEPIALDPGVSAEVGYRVRPVRRGAARFRVVHGRLRCGADLLRRQFTLPAPSDGRVYPRFLGVDRYDLLARIDRREEVRRVPRLVRGQGTDIESLRPYAAGDDLRHVDWKMSAKRGALISRNFQVERGQQLAILIDSGRFMGEPIGDRPRFEHALDAAVMLGWVAQQRGDTVAMACFSNRIESFLPPLRGRLIMPRMLDALCEVQPRNVESDYWHVFAQVLAQLKKRSLIVLLGEVLDRAGSSGLTSNLARAARKHVVLCVVLAEERVYEAADRVPADAAESYQKAAASHVLLEKAMALDDMRSKGIMVLETSPRHFSVQLVRRYLHIRSAGLL